MLPAFNRDVPGAPAGHAGKSDLAMPSGDHGAGNAYGKSFAELYDAIQAHRDLSGEVDRLHDVLRQTAGENAAILDLGCGTGLHALELAKRGFKVTGIDLSPDMIAVAQRKKGNATFVCGDIGANGHLGPFDACISLFNVINCLEGLNSLCVFFKSVAAVLKPGARLICECWNPIAVIQSPPTRVTRNYETDLGTISRTALPKWDFMTQELQIDYDVEIRPRKSAGDVEKFSVSHHLCLFTPLEVEFALKQAGFMMIEVRTALPNFEIATSSDRMLAISSIKE